MAILTTAITIGSCRVTTATRGTGDPASVQTRTLPVTRSSWGESDFNLGYGAKSGSAISSTFLTTLPSETQPGALFCAMARLDLLLAAIALTALVGALAWIALH
jgi:hypothetical protein